MDLSSSLISPLFGGRSLWNTCDYPSSILDPHFGTGLFNTNLFSPVQYRGYVLQPRTPLASPGQFEVKNEKEKFQVMLNVKQFKPEEVEVKVVDNFVVIHGKHEEKTDEHGFIQREFTRRYMLPEGTDAEKLKSSLTANGILTIEAPKKASEAPSNERVVPITMSTAATESIEDKK